MSHETLSNPMILEDRWGLAEEKAGKMKHKETNGSIDAGSEDKLTCAKPLQPQRLWGKVLKSHGTEFGQPHKKNNSIN